MGSRQVSPMLIPEQRLSPVLAFVDTLSVSSQWFNHVRLLGSHLTHWKCALSATLTTVAFDHSSLRWFAASPCRAAAEDLPPSLVQHRLRWIPLLHGVLLQRSWRTVVSRSSSSGFAATSGIASTTTTGVAPARLAEAFRALLDTHLVETVTLAAVGRQFGESPAHLVRCFTRTFGVAPHAYRIGRRIEMARLQLLDGRPAADVAVSAGFYDQSHFTRHFKRLVGTTPGRYISNRTAVI